MTDLWTQSAQAWIASQGEAGDFGRVGVLDRPMLAQVDACAPGSVLDVGCGEGRFCRMMAARGITCVGVDPTVPLLDAARAADPSGDYREARAEALPLPDAGFDMVVSYLTLIDIEGMDAALSEMVRALRPGGHLLIANIQGYNTACDPEGFVKHADGSRTITMERYLQDYGREVAWKGIHIVNYHRPLSRYITVLLGLGLQLRVFEEPPAHSGDPARVAQYNAFPWFHLMLWEKPAS